MLRLYYNAYMAKTIPTLEQARAFYVGADSAHDFEHILRVTAMAEHLAQHEGGKSAVVRGSIAARYCAPRGGPQRSANGPRRGLGAGCRRIFSRTGRGRRICRAGGRRNSFTPLSRDGTATIVEARILFDADKLDSIGAIGVARAYAVCGMLNQKLYSEPPPDVTATRKQHNAEHTPVDEYHVKLKHLVDRFYTPTAQKIARERHAYMEEFFARLTREVKGEWSAD